MDPVPALGEHTDAILAELGIDAGRRARAARGARRSERGRRAPICSCRAIARALRQGTGQRRRRDRARSGGRGAVEAKGRSARRDRRLGAAASPAERARVVVRINDASFAHVSPMTFACSAMPALPRVMLPKAEAARKLVRSVPPCRMRSVLALIESARGVRERRRRGRRRWRDAARSSARSTTRSTSTSTSRRLRRPGLRGEPDRDRVARRRARGTGGRRHAAARRRGAPAGRPCLVAAPRLRRQAVHPPEAGRGDPRRAGTESRRTSTGRAACWPPKPRRRAPPSSTAA